MKYMKMKDGGCSWVGIKIKFLMNPKYGIKVINLKNIVIKIW